MEEKSLEPQITVADFVEWLDELKTEYECVQFQVTEQDRSLGVAVAITLKAISP